MGRGDKEPLDGCQHYLDQGCPKPRGAVRPAPTRPLIAALFSLIHKPPKIFLFLTIFYNIILIIHFPFYKIIKTMFPPFPHQVYAIYMSYISNWLSVQEHSVVIVTWHEDKYA